MENYTFKQKMINVFKKYGYYMLLALALFAIVLTLVLVSVNANKEVENADPVTPSNTQTITPYMPVLNASIYKGYYGDQLVYNETLKQWETHNGIDFQVANGSKVYAILDGTVTDVYSNVLEGTVVVIEHDDGLTSTYGSLDEDLNVKVGDSIARGEEIGSVSSSAANESDAGAHLHFSMTDEGKKVDPASYLDITTK